MGGGGGGFGVLGGGTGWYRQSNLYLLEVLRLETDVTLSHCETNQAREVRGPETLYPLKVEKVSTIVSHY